LNSTLLISLLDIRIVIITPTLFIPIFVGSFINPPCIVHHQLKVSIIIDRSTDETIIISELFLGDHFIIDSFVVTILFKCAHEFIQYLLSSFFAIDEVRMSINIVDIDQIIDFYFSISIFIHLVKCLFNNPLSKCIHWSS